MFDGACLDVADTPENAKFFNRPGVNKGEQAAFPQARLSSPAPPSSASTSPGTSVGALVVVLGIASTQDRLSALTRALHRPPNPALNTTTSRDDSDYYEI